MSMMLLDMKKFHHYLFFLVIFLFLFLASKSIITANKDPVVSVTPDASLPYSIASHRIVEYNGNLYILGGSGIGDVDHDQILTSEIQADGSLSSWQETNTKLPHKILWHSVAQKNNRIYLLGGANGQPRQSTNKVYTSTINQDGSISDWIETTSLPLPLDSGEAFIYGDKIYFLGGISRVPSSIFQSKVYYATIDQNTGLLSSWLETTSLPEGRAAFNLITNKGKILVIAGTTSNSFATDDVLVANIESDGSINSWNLDVPLPLALHRPIHVLAGEHYYLIGGVDQFHHFLTTILYSPISETGLPDGWSFSNIQLSTPNCCFNGVGYNQYIYLPGGHNGSTYYKSTYKLKLLASQILDVPDLKQYSDPWGDDEYDNASDWSGALDDTMSRWGCALTSATMILQYYGLEATPGEVNSWMTIRENEGLTENFTSEGGVVWAAFSEYFRDHSDSQSGLEFSYRGIDHQQVKEELGNDIPVILRYRSNDELINSNHFVVATGIKDAENNVYYVNDPGTSQNETTEDVEDYWDMYLEDTGSFRKSDTDLSYIIIFVGEDKTLEVYDPDGNLISDEYFFLEGPILDAINKTDLSGNGKTLKALYYPKPTTGHYTVKLSGEGSYNMDLTYYDKDANSHYQRFEGQFDSDASKTFVIDFDKEDHEKSKVEEISFNRLLELLEEAYENEGIKRRGVYISLKNSVIIAEKLYNTSRSMSQFFMEVFVRKIEFFSSRHIDPETSQYLSKYAKELQETF